MILNYRWNDLFFKGSILFLKIRGQPVEFFFEAFGEVSAAGKADFERHFGYGIDTVFKELNGPLEAIGPDKLGWGLAAKGLDFSI